MPLILGKDGFNKELKEIYLGVGGVNRKQKEIYVGQGGVNKKVYKASSIIGEVNTSYYCVGSKFMSSLPTNYNFTVGLNGIKQIDIYIPRSTVITNSNYYIYTAINFSGNNHGGHNLVLAFLRDGTGAGDDALFGYGEIKTDGRDRDYYSVTGSHVSIFDDSNIVPNAKKFSIQLYNNAIYVNGSNVPMAYAPSYIFPLDIASITCFYTGADIYFSTGGKIIFKNDYE